MANQQDPTQKEDTLDCDGEDVRRSLLICSMLLLVAALFVKVHLVPAKHRYRATAREQRTVEAELETLRARNDSLRREVDALTDDSFYRERLRRDLFRITSNPEELILKPRP